jgi:hypothetical protein
MDSVLDSALDTPETEAPDTSTTDTSADLGPPDTGPVGAEDEPVPGDSGDEPAIGDDDEIADPEIDAQDNRYRVSKGRMERFQQARQFQEAVSEYVPSVEAAKELYEAASDFSTMMLDFRNPYNQVGTRQDGTPIAAVDAFMDHWNETSPEGMAEMATRMLPYMAQKNPSVVARVEGQVTQVLVNRAYRAAQSIEMQAPGSEQAKNALFWAQNLDASINHDKPGFKYKTFEELPRPQQPQQTELQRREQIQRQRELTFENSQWQAFSQQNLEGAKTTALESAVDNALKIVKDKFTPKILGSMRSSILAEAQQALKQNFEWNRNHTLEEQDIQREFRQALRTNQRSELGQRVSNHVAEYANRVARVVPNIARAWIQDQTGQVIDQNRQLHARAATAARQTLPSGNGRPAVNRAANGKFTSIEQGLDAILG